MKVSQFKLDLVGAIPEKLQAGILYVTTDGDVAGHLCACGCGREVITPISPTDWSLIILKGRATLEPSIGNWAFPCRSHYFIRMGGVVWAGGMSAKAIAQGRMHDKARKQNFYRTVNESSSVAPESNTRVQSSKGQSFAQRLAAWWKSLLGKP